MFDTLQGLAWSPTGEEIWFTAAAGGVSNRYLQAVTLRGSIRHVASIPGNLKLHDIAADGRVLLTKEDSRSRVYFVGGGQSTPRDLTWLEFAWHPVLSADGGTLLMTENDQSTAGKDMVYLRATDGSPAVRIGNNAAISLSPDARWVASTAAPASRPRRPNIVLLPVGPGEPIRVDTGSLQLTGDELPDMPKIGWLPDSNTILYAAKEPGRGPRAFLQDIHGGSPHPVTPEGIWGSILSMDGTRLLARDSRSHVDIYPVTGGAPIPLSFLSPEDVPLNFTVDGKWLYVIKRGERPLTIRRIEIDSRRTQFWREIPLSDPAGTVSFNSVQITPDGKSVAYGVSSLLSELYVAYGLR